MLDSHHERVQFIHESVRVYLLSHGLASLDGIPQHALEAKSHAKIIADCETYLQLCVQQQSSTRPQHPHMYKENPFLLDGKHPLRSYILYNLSTHIENAFVGDLAGFEQRDHLVRDLIAVHNSTHYQAYILRDHPAAFLMLSIEQERYALAKCILEIAPWCDLDTEDQNKQSRHSSATPNVPSRLNLKTLCGGRVGSALHAAVASDEVELVQLLIDKGANVNLAGKLPLYGTVQEYDSPVMLAQYSVKPKRKQILRLLLSQGVCVDAFGPRDGFNILQRASYQMDVETIKLCLARKANVNLRYSDTTTKPSNVKGSTALSFVLENEPEHEPGGSSAARLLIDAGAEVDDAVNTISMAKFAEIEQDITVIPPRFRASTFGRGLDPIFAHLISKARIRALQGKFNTLPRAPQVDLEKERTATRIPAPVRPRSRRVEVPIQHRYPVWCKTSKAKTKRCDDPHATRQGPPHDIFAVITVSSKGRKNQRHIPRTKGVHNLRDSYFGRG